MGKLYSVKRCPFCGGFGKLLRRNKTVVNGMMEYNCYVTCVRCGARGERFLFRDFADRETARIAAVGSWNRRVSVADHKYNND